MDESEAEQQSETEKPVEPRIEAHTLSQEQNSRIVRYINEKAASENDACPVCDSPVNTVLQFVFVIDAEATSGSLASGRHMPLYTTMCHDCGYVRFFNKILVDQQIRSAEKAAADADESDQDAS